MKHLSIIVPIYNVEHYIEKCLRSLEDQDIPADNYEIICVNDGSPDNSREVVVRLKKEFNNIILIDQENKGVSCARNIGIDKSSGKYLMFIDPDDYVDPVSFSRILNTSDDHKAQVSFLGYTILDENGRIRKMAINGAYQGKGYEGIETYFLSRGDGENDPDRMVAVLFETEFLNRNNLRYLPDVPYLEDGEFIARILCLAERCIFEGHSFYQRTTRPCSATSSNLFHSEKAINGFILAASNLKRFQQERNLNEKQEKFLNQPIVKFVLLSVNSAIGWKRYKKFSATVKTLKASSLRRIKLEGCIREYRICGEAYNLSPYLGVLALFLYPRINKLLQSFIIRKIILTK